MTRRYDLGETSLDDVSTLVTLWDKKSNEELKDVSDFLERSYFNFKKENASADISLNDLACQCGDDAIKLAEFMAEEWMGVARSHDISCDEYFNDPLGPGGWQINSSNQILIEKMVHESLSHGVEIRYASVVEAIDGESVALKGGDVIIADKILVTVSAGVLKSQSIQFDKIVQDVLAPKMEALEMGNLIKIMVPLTEGFFKDFDIVIDTAVYMVDRKCFIHARTGGKPVITIFQGGAISRQAECQNSVEINNLAVSILSDVPMFDKFRNYKAGDIFTTSWNQSPWSKGSYSVCRPGYKRSNPFNVGTIYFAGESFLNDARESPGQMRGAWKSGLMAADKILLEN